MFNIFGVLVKNVKPVLFLTCILYTEETFLIKIVILIELLTEICYLLIKYNFL